MTVYNENSLDSLCAGLAYAVGIDAPCGSAAANKALCEFVDGSFGGKKADRLFMYNPDAVAMWIADKYPGFIKEVTANTSLKLPLCSVMPSVTPVCFATMYSGVQPEIHGIRRYEKPVLTVDTLFDCAIRCNKKVAIVAEADSSIAKIFNDRKMDYYRYPSVPEVNAKASELIVADEYDIIVVYNGNYDEYMHKTGTESAVALAELRANSYAFGEFVKLIGNNWTKHRTLYGFAADHGCHDIDGGCGSHGLDMEEDLNIFHFYGTCGK